MIKLGEGEKIYVMEKWIMNEDYPYPTELLDDEVIEPYHNGWYLIAVSKGDEENVTFEEEFSKIDSLADFLKLYSGKNEIAPERHEDYQEEVNMEGHVEKICGLQWGRCQELRKKGIEIQCY